MKTSKHTETLCLSQSGFTLIELVTVIAILAIVAVFALPRFSDLQDEAELNSAEYIAASYKVAADLVKTTFNSKGFSTRTQNLEGFADGDVDTNNIGYPIGTTKGNGNENIAGRQGCVQIWDAILDNPPSVSRSNDGADYHAYIQQRRVCQYVYRASGDTAGRNRAQLVIRYDSRDGTVDVCGRRTDIPNC